jgi:CelD/BcsL family acetyltransferase involved in cellulose biosynthesis
MEPFFIIPHKRRDAFSRYNLPESTIGGDERGSTLSCSRYACLNQSVRMPAVGFRVVFTATHNLPDQGFASPEVGLQSRPPKKKPALVHRSMKLIVLDDVQQLKARAAQWDDLWRRSEVALPTARAALVALWIEQFAPQAAFRAVVVEHEGRWVAALPLVEETLGGVCRIGGLPSNDWTVSGEMLLDPAAERESLMELLAEGLRELPWPLLRLRLMRPDRAGWQLLDAVSKHASFRTTRYVQHVVGTIDLPSDFAAYEKSFSGNHRRHMGKAQRRLEREGGAELHVYSSLQEAEVEPLLAAGFQLEDRGWKGKEGTSVLATPGLFEFFLRQARLLGAWGQLQLAFLTQKGRPIAFEYGWRAKGVYGTPKVAFDEEFARYTPSQLLRYKLYERLTREAATPRVDFMGPLADATAKWTNGEYSVGATTIALTPVMGRTMLGALRLARAARQRIRPRSPAALPSASTFSPTAIAGGPVSDPPCLSK